MPPLNLRICQCMRQFFVKRPKFLSATSNLRAEQNLVHSGRLMHFSQKVVGVTLRSFPYMLVPGETHFNLSIGTCFHGQHFSCLEVI